MTLILTLKFSHYVKRLTSLGSSTFEYIFDLILVNVGGGSKRGYI